MSRRIWFAQDAAFLADPKVADLGAEHGAEGPLVIVHLLGLAKLQREGGIAKVKYGALARAAFISHGRRAKQIVHSASELGLLEILDEEGQEVVVAFPSWMRWQIKDPTNAERQQAYRDRNAARNAERNAEGNGEQRDDTVTPAVTTVDREQRTENRTTTTAPAAARTARDPLAISHVSSAVAAALRGQEAA